LATADPPILNGNTVTINLHNVTNEQTLGITLKNVTHGADVGDVGVAMGILLGDVTGNGAVSNTDIAMVKSQVSNEITASNFRADVTCNGAISNTDVSVVKAQVGTDLP
ncbi:MAG TPA: dockerin type I domain-containing protein, partial [Chthoniobacterales bacterium]|nr:dockerin type I domain-containing protein [Chthoniobacterales bacterium]